ncbi:bifunctional riboflavin kinase/FAD synthetase [Cesiribacter andamanensis]|uniref:Riboflavin biosynthesis protein n=1 Tax=Cesiribacter andamanensis AMV16 TaxID=1279009 RepID=M7N1F9_9BACT|nr:bifunctional riboflavin kinase/FAD synthetase [Cesiribacter andamanensis]EMR02518.1 Riboflavin biosynthesis protein ribF [Cesiribacter andamanensis AMV16]
MKIYDGLQDFTRLPHAVVTSGTFDGVHIGHQKILKQLVDAARQSGGESVLITFWPHPRLVLHADSRDLKLLSTFEEKAELLASFGVEHLVKIPFTEAFSRLSSSEFIQQVLVEGIGTKKLVIGYDHRFGRNREGSFEYLMANKARWGFEVVEISRQDVDHVGVSSTRIRKALSEGKVEEAAQFLGRPYSFAGLVVEGDKIGRNLGFPTANVEIPEHYKLIPSDGVYAVRVHHTNSLLPGMLNIGMRPTVGGQSHRLEVHIFGLEEDLYGQQLRLDLVQQIREELKFDSLDELRQQLALDKEQALFILQNYNNQL